MSGSTVPEQSVDNGFTRIPKGLDQVRGFARSVGRKCVVHVGSLRMGLGLVRMMRVSRLCWAWRRIISGSGVRSVITWLRRWMGVITFCVDVGIISGMFESIFARFLEANATSYICGGRQNRCKCPTEDTTEELDGNVDVRTIVTAMQQMGVQNEAVARAINEGAR